jgi:hypothetical protein
VDDEEFEDVESEEDEAQGNFRDEGYEDQMARLKKMVEKNE